MLEELRKKDNSVPNLYNVMMSYQNARSNNQTSEIDYQTKWITNDHIADSIDIHLFDLNDSGAFNIAYDYKTSKYTNEDISAMHNRLLHIINQILGKKDIVLKDIEIVTPEEKHQILYEFNDTKADYPKDKTIAQLFEEQVEKTPDNIAVVFEDQQLTYKELNEKANSLANYLRKKGIGKENCVAIRLDKNIDFIISILGVLKAGACYIPISMSYPIDRVKFIINDSKSKLLICNSENIDNFIFNNSNLILDLSKIDIDSSIKQNLSNINSPNDLAYIIYTSGSTGSPKGAMLTNKNLINFVYSFNDCFKNKFNSNDSCLSLTNISFDVSICEIFTPLLLGSKLVLYFEDSLDSIPSLCDFIIKNKITFLYIPPNLLNNIYSFFADNNRTIFIQKLLVGVSSIKNKDLNNFLKLNNKMEIINGYGPTEATICSTFYKYSKDTNENGIVPIGVPLNNNNIYILHHSLNLQPIKVHGELYVCGANVGKGYLNNLTLTEKHFISKLFDNNNCYNTGDLAYWNPNGTLSFVGRNDSQIKIKGRRIELDEINNVIKKLPNVISCITIVKKINEIDFICSFIVSEININENQIKNDLRKFLPDYMVPSYIVFLDSMPTNQNGKIDKNKLLLPIKNANTEIISPRNHIDTSLIEIIKNLLNLQVISIDNSIFDIGGDSLTAINLSTSIYKIFNVEIFVKDIFENPIIMDLSDLISKLNNSKKLMPIKKADKKDFYPTSSAQKRIYYSSLLDGSNSLLYNIAGGIILDKMPNIKKLSKCFSVLVNRHESLRTSFDTIDNEIVQKINGNINFKLEIDNNEIKENQMEKIFYSFVKPFDFKKAPLFNAKIITLENKKALLLVNMHHIISDRDFFIYTNKGTL